MSFYAQGRSVVGSIALIPLSSAALIVPDFRGLLLIVIAQSITELLKRRPALKFCFNVAQVTLGFGVGILLFDRFGGVPFGALESAVVESRRRRGTAGDKSANEGDASHHGDAAQTA